MSVEPHSLVIEWKQIYNVWNTSRKWLGLVRGSCLSGPTPSQSWLSKAFHLTSVLLVWGHLSFSPSTKPIASPHLSYAALQRHSARWFGSCACVGVCMQCTVHSTQLCRSRGSDQVVVENIHAPSFKAAAPRTSDRSGVLVSPPANKPSQLGAVAIPWLP